MGHRFINLFQEADKCTLQGLEPHSMAQSSSSAMSEFQPLPTVEECFWFRIQVTRFLYGVQTPEVGFTKVTFQLCVAPEVTLF